MRNVFNYHVWFHLATIVRLNYCAANIILRYYSITETFLAKYFSRRKNLSNVDSGNKHLTNDYRSLSENRGVLAFLKKMHDGFKYERFLQLFALYLTRERLKQVILSKT